MARMVDADALAKAMGVYTYMQTEWTHATAWGVPIVDAEPVVRCKDCKYCSVDSHADGNVPNYVCIEMDCGVEADGFCSWGERKDGEDE